VSVRKAVRSANLETLQATVQQQFLTLDEREKQARTVLARLETNFMRQFMAQGGDDETF
jgi:F-type H+-transporting ATPase subunit epsilon